MNLFPPLATPKNGRAYEILIVCRVSNPREGGQDIRSLDDQRDNALQWIGSQGIANFEVTVLAGTGSGEILDRAEFRQLEDFIASSRFDLIVTEDLGRILRRIHVIGVCELAQDHNTRLIAINDSVDTGKDGWQDSSLITAWHHERSNRDTSNRIKRTHRSRFLQGGCLHTPLYGYIKPPGAKHDGQLLKDPAAETVYKQWFTMLDSGASFAQVADWLNETKVPLPPGARTPKWERTMVSRHTFNPILKGIRVRNRRKSKRINGTGRYVSVKAEPEELLTRPAPHLAFFEADYYDRVVAKVMERNAHYRRAKNGPDPRKGVPKKRSRFPGQTIFCGVCGGMFVYGGHGRTSHLVCDGARNYSCWNGATIDGPLAARKVAQAVFAEIDRLEGFDSALLRNVQDEAIRLDSARTLRIEEIDRQLAQTERALGNLIEFVSQGNSDSVRGEIQRLDSEKRGLDAERKQLQQTPTSVIEIPTADMLRQLARGAFAELAEDSFEFARLMRIIIPKIVVFPVRLLDSNRIVQRGRFRLHLTNLLPDTRVREAFLQPMERTLTLDLFVPPQGEYYRQKVVAMRAAGMTEAKIAAELKLTIPAAQRAAGIQREMDRLGITDPYLPVTEPPADDGKYRRHHHPRYRFQPKSDPGAF